MSQPPSPPPPDGFGAPPDPPPVPTAWDPPAQGGHEQSAGYGGDPMGHSPYGQPPYEQQQQPYGQPAYGQTPYQQAPYGQAPYGQTPYGQTPYGAPAPPPVPPGYPVPPGHPAPYVWPTPAPAPPGGTGGGRKGLLRRKPGVVVAGAVAALLVVGGGGWIALSGGSEPTSDRTAGTASERDGGERAKGAEQGGAEAAGPDRSGDGDSDGGEGSGDGLTEGRKAGEARVAFVTTNDIDLPRNGVDAFGPWVAGDIVARAYHRGMVGHSTADGGKKWSLPVPTDVCSATLNPSAGGKVVIGVKDGTGERAECLELWMVDIRTGEVGWKKRLTTGEGFGSLTDFTLTISGNTVGVAGLGNSFGLSLADGKQLFKGPASGCKPFAFAGGPRLLAAAACPVKDWTKPRHRLQEIDPRTGKAKWTYEAPEGWEVEKVFSADPVVISLKQTQEKKWGVVALTGKGTERSRVQGGTDRFQPRCGGNFVVLGEHLEGCIGVAADDDALYMATQPQRPGGANEIVAFDLDTGKQSWRSPSGGDSTIMPLRMEGSAVLAYREPTYDRGGLLATVAPTGGAPKPLLRLPDATAGTESSFYSPRLVYEGGTFFIASGRVSARNDAEEKQTRTMMAVTR
ncbi:PQQ-binding-like beta-propeller repeat protein [Streptomyces sp. NPDC000594]|uniref:outer membrane protein assembly factor BamB family protein n=1 Tax=Streptomyces sp. NPDC000594 TaxID=3154261 RepID=UPI0033199467